MGEHEAVQVRVKKKQLMSAGSSAVIIPLASGRCLSRKFPRHDDDWIDA
jgi:hypothetical protein